MGKAKIRGNGQGCAIRVGTNNWKAVATIGFTEDGRIVRRTKSGFKTKSEALDYIPILKNKKDRPKDMTFKAVYDEWFEKYKTQVSKSTMWCYQAAFKVFEDCWYYPISDEDIDELQNCIDSCDKGDRTKQNAKVVASLLYKYAIPRGYVEGNLNKAQFLKVRTGEKPCKHAFTDKELATIKENIGIVPYADMIYIHCYLGFRPSELLALTLDNYNKKENCFVGGIKTEAGKNRTVTVSPKIMPFLEPYLQGGIDEPIFKYRGEKMTLGMYRTMFYRALALMGITQSEDDHRLTPHCCRHTFATLIKNIDAADKDKMELMGHASDEMLRYYQDVNYNDLRKITDRM